MRGRNNSLIKVSSSHQAQLPRYVVVVRLRGRVNSHDRPELSSFNIRRKPQQCIQTIYLPQTPNQGPLMDDVFFRRETLICFAG